MDTHETTRPGTTYISVDTRRGLFRLRRVYEEVVRLSTAAEAIYRYAWDKGDARFHIPLDEDGALPNVYPQAVLDELVAEGLFTLVSNNDAGGYRTYTVTRAVEE